MKRVEPFQQWIMNIVHKHIYRTVQLNINTQDSQFKITICYHKKVKLYTLWQCPPYEKTYMHYASGENTSLPVLITFSLSLSVCFSAWPHSTLVWEIEQSKLSEEPLPVVYLRSLSCDSVSWGGCMRPVWGENMVALLILLMWTPLPHQPHLPSTTVLIV